MKGLSKQARVSSVRSCRFFHSTCSFVLIFASILVLAGCHADPNDDTTYSGNGDFFVRNGDIRLAARVHLPPGEGPHPALVVIGGSAPWGKADLEPFVEIFNNAGFALIGYDRRGIGESTGTFRGLTVENSFDFMDEAASDANAIFELARNHAQIDPNRIGLFGSSQGGWVTIRATASNPHVAFMLIAVSTPLSVGHEGFHSLLADDTSPFVPNRPLPNGFTFEQLADSLKTFQGPYGYDARPLLESITVPGFWVFGGRDRSTPTLVSVEVLENFRTRLSKDFTIQVFPYANHDLLDDRTGAFTNEVIDEIQRWLRARFLSSTE